MREKTAVVKEGREETLDEIGVGAPYLTVGHENYGKGRWERGWDRMDFHYRNPLGCFLIPRFIM